MVCRAAKPLLSARRCWARWKVSAVMMAGKLIGVHSSRCRSTLLVAVGVQRLASRATRLSAAGAATVLVLPKIAMPA